MSTAVQAKLGARELVAQYLDEYIVEEVSPENASTALAQIFCRFKVGPFQFALAKSMVTDEALDLARVISIEGAALVPPRYREHVSEIASSAAPDWLVLKGGRVAITGVLRVGEFEVADDAIVARGIRADAPWIAGSLKEPPSFVLDPDALQLHFMRRAS